MAVISQISVLTLPSGLPHPEAIKSFGAAACNYEPDFWEFEYQIYRYLGRISDNELLKRHREIVRNMEALTTPDRNAIPIESFLSSWYWFRKEHQTRFEFLLRGKLVEPPYFKDMGASKLAKSGPPRPKHPNAADVLFRYGQRAHLSKAVHEGILRIFRASKQKEKVGDEARFDDECAKRSFMPGQYARITTMSGETIPIHGDVSRLVSGPDYYMLCMSGDWDPKLFDDFSKSDCCLAVRDAEAFANRLEMTAQSVLPASSWFFHHNPVEYFDPYEIHRSGYIDTATRKDFRFAYQREYRFLWFPIKGDQTEEFRDLPPLGSLGDIAQLWDRPT